MSGQSTQENLFWDETFAFNSYMRLFFVRHQIAVFFGFHLVETFFIDVYVVYHETKYLLIINTYFYNKRQPIFQSGEFVAICKNWFETSAVSHYYSAFFSKNKQEFGILVAIARLFNVVRLCNGTAETAF